MIEKITRAYAVGGDDTDLNRVVRDVLCPGTVQEQVQTEFLRQELALHGQFHQFISHRGAVETRQYHSNQGTRRWQAIAHTPVPIMNRLKAIPFTEYDMHETGWQWTVDKDGKPIPAETKYEMQLTERAIGFVITTATARQALISRAMTQAGKNTDNKRFGLVRRTSPNVISELRLGISSADVENQKRFGFFLSEIIEIDGSEL
ncbi:MAG TPA: hypothetical protein VK978_03465 [Candidatus Saccharimonadales bacterium]|nr:hypothetical protein [Candidatus Saccharimonadales bacterium]